MLLSDSSVLVELVTSETDYDGVGVDRLSLDAEPGE